MPAPKTKKKVNKAALVREHLEANPDAKPADVAAAINKANKGLGLTAQYVSTTKSNMKSKPDKAAPKKRGPKKGSKRKAANNGQVSGDILNNLRAAKKFVDDAGGFEAAGEALRALSKLQ